MWRMRLSAIGPLQSQSPIAFTASSAHDTSSTCMCASITVKHGCLFSLCDHREANSRCPLTKGTGSSRVTAAHIWHRAPVLSNVLNVRSTMPILCLFQWNLSSYCHRPAAELLRVLSAGKCRIINKEHLLWTPFFHYNVVTCFQASGRANKLHLKTASHDQRLQIRVNKTSQKVKGVFPVTASAPCSNVLV